jgi:hypothetical protein
MKFDGLASVEQPAWLFARREDIGLPRPPWEYDLKMV